jgi:hypothetical protein
LVSFHRAFDGGDLAYRQAGAGAATFGQVQFIEKVA